MSAAQPAAVPAGGSGMPDGGTGVPTGGTAAGAGGAGLRLDAALPWSNAVFVRFRRSRLRLRKAVFWYLLTLIVATFVVSLTYIVRTAQGVPADVVARGLWLPLLIIQGLILLVKGTGSTSAGLIQDRIDQTLDYQRLTPASPLRNLVGYLVGLPVLEYVMFALTLPHLAFIVAVGEIPLATVLAVYLAFFVCAVLYHTIGISTGMVMRRWIWGYMLSILMVLFVNVVLPGVVSQFGLKFLQYLSVWPVIGEKVLPLTISQIGMPGTPTQTPFLNLAADVPFFNGSLSPFLFTLALQSALIATFGIMALRRWKSSTRHALSKPYALAFLSGFIVLLLGNIWPVITRQSLPFPIFGRRSLDELGEVIALGSPLVYALVVWLLCLVLFAIIVPTHHSTVRGMRRARKLGRPAPSRWDDDAGSIAIYGLFTAVAVAGFGVLFLQIASAGYLATFDAPVYAYWRLPLAFTLVVFYTALLLQALGGRPTVLVALLLWCLPILVAIVFAAQTRSFDTPHAVIAVLSPLAWLIMCAVVPIRALAAGPAEPAFEAGMAGTTAGLVFITLQIAVLWGVWLRRRKAIERAGTMAG